MKNFFDDIRNDAKREFNPTLNELNNALTKAIRTLKGDKLENKSIIFKGFSIYNEVNSDNSFFSPANSSETFLVAIVDGKYKEVGLENNLFSGKSKIIDIVISINSLEQSNSYSSEFRESLLNFAVNKVMIQVEDGYKSLKPKLIVYLEADGHFTKIFLANGEMITYPKPIGYFKDILPLDNFYTTHASYYLNVNYIDSIDKEKQKVFLDNLFLDDKHKDFRVSIPISDKWELGFLDFLQRRQRL